MPGAPGTPREVCCCPFPSLSSLRGCSGSPWQRPPIGSDRGSLGGPGEPPPHHRCNLKSTAGGCALCGFWTVHAWGHSPEATPSATSILQGKIKGAQRGAQDRCGAGRLPPVPASTAPPPRGAHPLTVASCSRHIFPMASFSLITEAKRDSNGFAQKWASSASSFRQLESGEPARAICCARLI